MNFDFTFILVVLTAVTGVISLFDLLFWSKKRKTQRKPMAWPIDYSRSLFPVFLIVIVLRSFVVEPYRIPSGSLKPTLFDGDFILVNKFDYGLRLPIINFKILKIGEPERGDIVVFHWPPNPDKYDLIKRVIGVPGDHIDYINKTLYLNGKQLKQSYIGEATDNNGDPNNSWPVKIYAEDLPTKEHQIYIAPGRAGYDIKNIVVPPHMYFMMGDNRDDSADSRFWGFVPENDIVGKAFVVLFSWNSQTYWFRLPRTFTLIK